MVIFWLCALLLVGATLALLVPPLLGRRQPALVHPAGPDTALFRDRLARLEHERRDGQLTDESYREARGELERELLAEADGAPTPAQRRPSSSPLMAILVVAFVPLAAFGLYLQLGTPGAFDGTSTMPASRPAQSPVQQAAASGQIPHSLEEMVARLEARLADAPDDADGWVMLGRSYAAFNRLPESRDALLEANALRPDHPLTLVALAETLAGLQGNRLDGEPERLVRRALAMAPDFPRALWLVGVIDYRRGDGAAAAASWRRLLHVGGLGEAETRRVRDAIAAAEGVPAATTPPATASAARAGSAAAAALTVHVSLAPELAPRASPSDVVFVFARAAQGPPMPLAVSRHTVAELPLTVTLDDSMAMAPQMRLSMFDAVVVGARISRSGSATPSPGDLRGQTPPLSPAGAGATSVLIDGVVP